MPAPLPFTACRDERTHATYRLLVPLPVTVRGPSLRQTLRLRRRPYPPQLSLEFESTATGPEVGCVYELESRAHGERIVRDGLRVVAHGMLDRFCQQLVREGRAVVAAGPHCDIPWASHVLVAIDRRFPHNPLDAFWAAARDDAEGCATAGPRRPSLPPARAGAAPSPSSMRGFSPVAASA